MVFDAESAKAFAGPVATIIASMVALTASIAALVISNRFGRIQARIAEQQKDISKSQRDIAYDRLKYDLLDKRYEIYLTAKFIIERIIRSGVERPIDDLDLLAKRIKLDEAQFFFPPKEVLLFERIDDLASTHEMARALWNRSTEDDEIRRHEGDVMAGAVEKLIAIHEQLPKLMKDELGFAQLTSLPLT